MSSQWQLLIAAAQRVCDLVAENAPGSGLRMAIGQLRTAVGAVHQANQPTTFDAWSGVGLETGRPFVELGGPPLPMTMGADDARRLAYSILDAAAAAEHDALLVAELRAHDAPLEVIAGMLAALRERRASAPTTQD